MDRHVEDLPGQFPLTSGMRAIIQAMLAGAVKRRVLLLCIAVGCVAGWRLVAWGVLSSARRLAADLASVTVFVGPGIPNHSGNQLVYMQNTETGLGIFTADLRTGSRQLVFNVEEAFVRSESVRALGWSPDGAVFGYTIPVKSNRQHIVVCSGYVGKAIDRFAVGSQVTSFSWVSANAFVYADQAGDIRLIARNTKGKWAEKARAACRGEGEIENLSVLSSSTVAWKQNKSIYRMSLESAQPELLWRSPAAARVDLAGAPNRATLLIGVAEGRDGYSVVSLYPGPPPVTNLLQVFQGRRIAGLRSLNAGRGYALICADPVGRTLLISPEGRPADQPLFPEGNVQNATPQGSKLYIVGSTNVEPPGIWEYDCLSRSMRWLLSGSDKGTALYPAFRHEAKVLAAGDRQVTYHLWMPQPTMFRAKFPVVIGQTPYAWTPYPYVAAQAGFCFVTVDRPSWSTDLDQWAGQVMAVYEHLKSNPRVDTSEAYLYGRSAETYYLSSLAAQTPQLWKGALLFSPGSLPDLRQCKFPKMFVDVGERDHNTLQRLAKYQVEAALLGVPVRVLVHETSRHTSWSQTTQRARLENLGIFLSRQ